MTPRRKGKRKPRLPFPVVDQTHRQVLGVALSAALMQAILQRRLSADITGPGSHEVRVGGGGNCSRRLKNKTLILYISIYYITIAPLPPPPPGTASRPPRSSNKSATRHPPYPPSPPRSGRSPSRGINPPSAPSSCVRWSWRFSCCWRVSG